MKYNFTSGIRPHTGKYHIYRGTMPQTDMNRLAAVIAVVLAVTVAAFGFALNNVPEAPNFPPASVSSQNSSQPSDGQSAPDLSGVASGDSGNKSSNQSNRAANASPVLRPLTQRQSAAGTPSGPQVTAPAVAGPTAPAGSTQVGGRGGGEAIPASEPPADTGCGCIGNLLDDVQNTLTEAPAIVP